MVRKTLKRLHYRLKGWLIDRRARSHKFREEPPSRKLDVVEKGHLWQEPPEGKKADSGKRVIPAPAHVHAQLPNHERLQARGASVHSPLQPEILQPILTQHPPKHLDFHPYRKRGAWEKLQLQLQERGMPPLPILLLTAIVLIGAAMSIFSIGIYAFSPKEADVYVAIQALDGNVLKGAMIVLSDSATFERKYSAEVGADGLAYFRLLPVNAKFVVHAEKGGGRIEVDDRELKVPLPQGRKEIIFVKRAVS